MHQNYSTGILLQDCDWHYYNNASIVLQSPVDNTKEGASHFLDDHLFSSLDQ